jgi:SAM-dependent methyltransferase
MVFKSKQVQNHFFEYVLPDSQEEKWYEKYNEKGDDYFPFWVEEWPAAFGLWYFIQYHKIKASMALEIGCGAGVLGQLGMPFSFFQSDFLWDATCFASTNNKLPAVVMDMGAPCFSNVFDLVLAADIFYHDSLPKLFYQSLKSCLKPGGIAIVCSPRRVGQKLIHDTLIDAPHPFKKRTMYISMDKKFIPFDYHVFYAS